MYEHQSYFNITVLPEHKSVSCWLSSSHSPITSLCASVQSVQSLSRVRLFATPCIAACQASLSITNSRSSSKLMSIESVVSSSHLILCRPLLFLPPIPPRFRVFSNESALCMRWAKYQSFSFSISPFKEHPGLISFRMDWLDLSISLKSTKLFALFFKKFVLFYISLNFCLWG